MRFCSVNENVRKKIIANLMVAPKCWSKRLVEDIPIEEFENISPAAQRVEQQSDNGEGRQRAMEVAQECDNTPEEGDTLEGAGEVGTSLYLSQDTPTPAADEVDAPTNQRHLSSSGSLGRIKLSVHHGSYEMNKAESSQTCMSSCTCSQRGTRRANAQKSLSMMTDLSMSCR
ncbi:hypothetical protein O3P69_012262 [Scylla paramamosain]